MDAIPGARVLVVDDRADTADSTAMLLRLSGHDVHVAYDGKACLALAARTRFDAILLDIGMPQLDGFRVARQLRKKSACQDAVLIAITGFADEGHRQQGMAAGFDDYLAKPVDPELLVAKLGRI